MNPTLKMLLCQSLILLMALKISSGDRFEDTIIDAVTSNAEKKFMEKFLNNCTSVRRQFGIDAEEDRFDVGKLRLEFWHDSGKVSFNLDEFGRRLNETEDFNNDKPIVVFVHGFLSSSMSSSSIAIVRNLQKKGLYNVFALDASRLLKMSYLLSSSRVFRIGRLLGKALISGEFNADKIHLIGHSLGAHIAGFAGKYFEETTGEKISRISALDPAGPCFFQEPKSRRLSREDADFVDVIHTNMGVYGYIGNIGDVDFYPNNGMRQPGCINSNCSHSRSWKLYAESIDDSKAFLGVSCENWAHFYEGKCAGNPEAYMGFYAERNAAGSYYLRTSSTPPYGLGRYGIKRMTPIEALLYLIDDAFET